MINYDFGEIVVISYINQSTVAHIPSVSQLVGQMSDQKLTSPHTSCWSTALIKTRLEILSRVPFTIQRLCELLMDPRHNYTGTDKFLRGLEKVKLKL